MSSDAIAGLYEAFRHRDGDAMAACYTDDAEFSDPVFTDLRGPQVGAMWRMLTSSGRDLHVTLIEHRVDGAAASAHWLADYTFSRTGRRVHNDVHASFRLGRDGRIAAHHDSFNFYAWAKQALGPLGALLGWAPPFQAQLRASAAATLATYMEREQPAGVAEA